MMGKLINRAIAGAIVIIGFGLSTAHATHEANHRFTVVGTVTYEDGAPVPREKVAILGGDETELGSVRTDAQGLYRTVLHLHDPDLGKVFDLKVQDQKKKVRVQFDPDDKTTERGVRVDFVLSR